MAMAMECVQMDTWDKDRTEHTDSGKHGRAYFSNLDTEELGQMSLGSGSELALSPKFNNPTARPPRTTVKCSHERKVRSFAKETFGSTRTGSAMRFVAVRCSRG